MTFYSGQNGRMELYEAQSATGGATAVALVNNGDDLTQTGTQTNKATAPKSGDSGSGLTVDFDIEEKEAVNLELNTPGSGYTDGQLLDVTGYNDLEIRVIRSIPKRLAKVASWSIQTNSTTLDTTTLGDTDSTSCYGIRESTGQARIFYYENTDGDNDCAKLMKKLIKVRNNPGNPEFAGVADEPDYVRLKLDVMHGTTTKSFDFVALITSASMVMSVGEVLSADISFKVQGAFTGLTVLN